MQGVLTENLVFTNWDLEVDGELKNNGHTIKFTPFPGIPAITTRTHLGEYQLAQFHMHWGENDGAGSEHRINGHQAALEIHFVHERVAPSGPDSEKYLVVGVLVYAGSNSPQSPLINRLPISVMPETGYWVMDSFVRMDWFLPADRSYYYYEGSLTTPTCDESVQRFVMKEAITVPRVVLEYLRKVKTATGSELTFNYRDVQPLRCRRVYEHDDPGQCPNPVSPISYTYRNQPLDGALGGRPPKNRNRGSEEGSRSESPEERSRSEGSD